MKPHKFTIKPGMLRFILAFVVMIEHYANFCGKGPTVPIDGTCVWCFFYLSGYWIKSLWDGKYSLAKQKTITFYISRMLRIYPLALIATFLMMFTLTGSQLSLPLLLKNLLIIDYPPISFLNPPMWSLTIELQFYLIAPFLLMMLNVKLNQKILFILSLISTACYVLIASSACLLTVLLFFLLGVFSYKHLKLFDKLATKSLLLFIVLFAVLHIRNIHDLLLPSFVNVKLIGVLLALTIIPYVGASLQITSSKIDRVLGNLAYPIYLFHWPLWLLISRYFTHSTMLPEVAITLAGSLLLYFVIDKPIENFRKRWVEKRIIERGLFDSGAGTDTGTSAAKDKVLSASFSP